MKNLVFLLLAVCLIAGCGRSKAKQEGEMAQKTAYFERGLEELKSGKVADAMKDFENAIRNNPRDSRPYLVLGRIYIAARDYQNAVYSLEFAKKIFPDNGEVRMLLAESYDRSGKREEAIKNVQESLNIYQQKRDEENFVKALVALRFLTEPQTQN